MKAHIILIFMALTVFNPAFSQSQPETRVPLLGEQAPKFTAESTLGRIDFPGENNTKWTILFSHPADFTAVCSSEILELAMLQNDFDRLNTRLMVISTDAVSSHIEWVSSLEKIAYQGREPVKIRFPLISDKDLSISKKFGMIHPLSSNTKDVRGVFIMDPGNRISAIFYYPNNVGRNLNEIKRTLIALQTSEKHDVLIPANWEPGRDVMLTSPKTATEADKLMQKNDPDLTHYSWYMWFRKLK